MIGTDSPLAERRHRVTLQNPGPAVPDGDGGFTQTWADLVPPTLLVSIEPATAQGLERIAAGTTLAVATHIVMGAYHPQVTTKTRLLFDGRVLQVTYVGNPGERKVDLALACVEVVA